MPQFTAASANINKRLRHGRLHRALDRATNGVDVVALQEIESDPAVHAVANLPGRAAYFPAGADDGKRARNACPITWHLMRFALVEGGCDIVGEGIGGVQPDRPLTWVILKDRRDGTRVGVLSAHTVSGLWRRIKRTFRQWAGRTRREEAAHELDGIAERTEWLTERCDVVVGGGDLNHRKKIHPARLSAEHVAYAAHPTHGRHWYDVIWLVGAGASHVRTIGSPSDHDVLVATVTPTDDRNRHPKEEPVSIAPPSPPYLGPAAHDSGGGNKPIRRVVIHSTVSPCEPGGARDIARYFNSEAAGGSAHYITDPSEVVQDVYDSVIAWHAPPNPHSLGIEMCDKPSRINALRWAGKNHRSMLALTAHLTAQLCLAYDVPIRFLTVADLKAGRHGITTHNNVSRAFHESTHWDPGAWPRRKFMRLVRQAADDITSGTARTAPEEDEVTPQDIEKIAEAVWDTDIDNHKADKSPQGHMKARVFITNLEQDQDALRAEVRELTAKIERLSKEK